MMACLAMALGSICPAAGLGPIPISQAYDNEQRVFIQYLYVYIASFITMCTTKHSSSM